ncbi:hypothetical protein M0722_01550 [Microbacterium sp. KSW4-16]|uniref:hypothetical protein n=1 Tax=Microbacterium aurugineum TaxID=2851642 RepID=UPI0020BFD5F1|nr:hypothetical protein [Microbacterium aurugineum]MCK8465867.1 hypothetical protein [Microbacterium aurugineum]
MADWYTATGSEETERLLGAWPDAPVENVELCELILDTAKEQVLAFAPALDEGATVPDRWVYAQLQQATNLWNAGRVSGSGDVGIDQYTYTPRPLDKTIKSIIRPAHGGPRVR